MIGSDCVIERSIIGANVSIKDQTRVSKGCLVGDGVIVGPSAVLRPFERLSKRPDESERRMEEDEDVDSDLEDVEASAFRSWSSLYFLTISAKTRTHFRRRCSGKARTLWYGPEGRPVKTRKRKRSSDQKMNDSRDWVIIFRCPRTTHVYCIALQVMMRLTWTFRRLFRTRPAVKVKATATSSQTLARLHRLRIRR